VDIRTKLILALVAVSLGSMIVLGAVVSPRVEQYLRDGMLQQLDQLAEAKDESLGWIIAGWRDGTDLVASRTQLRALVDEHRRAGGEGSAARIEAILAEALDASRSGTRFEIYDAEGRSVAATERGNPAPAEVAALAADPGTEPAYAGVTVGEDGSPQVTFLASLALEGRPVGSLLAVFEAPELLELTAHHHGLGETGETLIFATDAEGVPRTLHPTRHAASVVLAADPDALATRAMAGDTEPIARGVTDYRGHEVFAATRLVEETGWGLVVKIDRAEAMQRGVDFNAWLRQTAVILAAFAIVLGLVLALRFALPIHTLAAVAEKVRGGDMSARASVTGEDEIGLLAHTFNGMADDLERRMQELRQYRRFFDVTIDLMCIAGTDGYFRRTNPAFERELGWRAEELAERPFLDFVHPDDVARTRAEVEKLAQGIPTISFENRYLCKDGSYKLLRWTSYPEGDVLYAIARVLDRAPTA
jgi:PAS domain S-box-containing protein